MKILRYAKLSLIQLIRFVVSNQDQFALLELHRHRKPFRHKEKEQLCIVEFIDALRQEKSNSWGTALADAAYELTVDKFSNLPETETDLETPMEPEDSRVKRKGPDCRCYYRAFWERMEKLQSSQPIQNPIAAELLAVKVLQNLVKRHFYFSYLECKRKTNPWVSRYLWKVNGKTMNVWLPIILAGKERKKWLETHIRDVDPNRPGEKDRVQRIINQHWSNGKLIRFHDNLGVTKHPEENNRLRSELDFQSLNQFANLVAEEKAESIDQQRPTIQTLGKENLKNLIQKIFQELEQGTYRDGEIAREFGLSKSTFSRFAGSRWDENPDDVKKGEIPDLWINIAGIIIKNPGLAETAREAGVWSRIQAIHQSRVVKNRGEL